MLFLEILSVIIATLILFFCGAVAIRDALAFRKSMNKLMSKVEAKAQFLMDQSEAAQRRTVSIVESKELLGRKLLLLRVGLAKMRVIVTAAKQAWIPVVKAKAYIGL